MLLVQAKLCRNRESNVSDRVYGHRIGIVARNDNARSLTFVDKRSIKKAEIMLIIVKSANSGSFKETVRLIDSGKCVQSHRNTAAQCVAYRFFKRVFHNKSYFRVRRFEMHFALRIL